MYIRKVRSGSDQCAVYTTPAPKGTLTNTPNIRRRSDDPPKSSHDTSISAVPAMAGALAAASSTTQRPASASSSQPSTAPPMALRTSAPLATPMSKNSIPTVDSPVMNETLSVIDEHMNDMNVPRSPFPNGSSNTLASSLASTPQRLAQYSYIAGHETDEEESHLHGEDEVLSWSPDQVAEYLEDNGVERAHCEVFKEQEISGEVLLAMEQSSIFLKEFELGPVGRRLKTWHKIRQLQDEVRSSSPAKVPRSNSEYSNIGDDGSTGDAPRNRASTMGSILPRALDPRQSTAQPQRSTTLQSLSSSTTPSDPTRSSGMSPLQSMTSMTRSETASRPSAQIIREMQHSRRHSSMDSTKSASLRQGHRKQPSLDQRWQLGQLQTNGSSSHGHTLSADTGSKRQSAFMTTSPDDVDRGYFSSSEADSRPHRRSVLTKRNSAAAASPGHSRQSSSATQRNNQSVRGQISSPVGPVSPIVGGFADSGIFGPLDSVNDKYGSMRSVTAPTAQVKPSLTAQTDLNPVVTKLDYSNGSNESSMAQAMRKDSTQKSSSPISKMSFFTTKPKMTGLRTISDAITRSEKSSASPTKEGAPFSSRTGSTTPSTETQSFEMQKSEAQSHHSNGSATNLPLPSARQQQKRMKPKTKKSTSAYTRGLEQKTPAEQMATCDYSGWMRKKSGSLMTTWKPRLFVLKGRRLSYYYADSDTEEKGLIDISFHRVLPAQNETLTGIHATVTGATNNTASSPRESSTPTSAQRDLASNPPPAGDESMFIFKLVPPKSGLSKGVNFTRPTVHYFAVNSRQEGRLWMAALMKATIDYDENGKVTTTYNQKTISLAKARARRERPPALREDPPNGTPEDEGIAELDGSPDINNTGLGIGGLGDDNDAVAGAAKSAEDASLYTMGTTAVAESNEKLVNKEGEGIAS